MSHSPLQLHEGAIFLSDAHYSFKHNELLPFLKALRSQEIQTPQLLLMGDIFDLLFGGIPETTVRNQEAVDLINTLSDNIEIIYLEGNHDFNLVDVFPGVTLFPIEQQPVSCHYKEQRVKIAHGDFNAPAGYRLYTLFIRNPFILKGLGLLNRVGGQFILKGLDRRLQRKDDCKSMDTFETYISRHLSKQELHEIDLFIEGHYHQDLAFNIGGCHYVNLPAFACGSTYMRLEEQGMVSEHFGEHAS